MTAMIEGMLQGIQPHDIHSAVANGDIPFGRVVAQSTAPSASALGIVKLPTLTGDLMLGISVHQHNAPATVGGSSLHESGKILPVLKNGLIAMLVEDAMTPTSSVFVRFTANGAGKIIGQIRSDADTDKAVVTTKIRIIQGAAAGGIAIVQADF